MQADLGCLEASSCSLGTITAGAKKRLCMHSAGRPRLSVWQKMAPHPISLPHIILRARQELSRVFVVLPANHVS